MSEREMLMLRYVRDTILQCQVVRTEYWSSIERAWSIGQSKSALAVGNGNPLSCELLAGQSL